MDTKVNASLSVTINLGNFQNLKLEFGIEDYRRSGETMEQASERVFRFVESQLEKRIEETMETVRNGIDKA